MKKKINFRKLLLMFMGFLIVGGLTIENPITLQVNAAVSIPQVSIVSLDHSPFVQGDKNEFFIASKGYTGKVQYQLFYTCETTMGSKWQLINNSDMSNGWTSPVNGQQPVKVDITNLKLSADYYRFAIRVRRVGVKGKFSNSYGDYDSVYPFTMDVLKNKDINLNGDILINKNEFTQMENLKIQGTSTDTSSVQYKLHLYDVKNDKWLNNLTEYSDNIDYNLSKLPAGTYIVDIWGKNKQSTNKYDGWKLSIINIKNQTIPKVNIVSLEHSPFVEKESNEFFISSKDYNGQVQYQLFYTCETTMKGTWALINNDAMVNGWTKATSAQEPVKVDISKLNLKAESYRFAIRVRRVGVQGKYKNQYGDYDDAYPFNVTVASKAAINLSGNILMDKTTYAKNDQLKINGIVNAPENTQYKLHLYDAVNNKWLNNLTEYSTKINYDLSNIPAGTYILNIWGKSSSGAQKYDGWKLKVIQITSDLIKISDVEDINAKVKRNTRYMLPQTVTATLADGSKVLKAVLWNTEANTSKAGIYELFGAVLGSDKKVKLILEVEETRGNTSGNTINLGIVAEKDGWIFYSNYSDDGKLYKATKDGKNITKICDDNAYYINIVGDWIYYSNTLDELKIYKINTNGTNRTKLLNVSAEQLTVENDWIYFINDLEEFKIYKVKTDGTSLTKVNNDASINLNLKDDFIYYSNLLDDGKIYKVRTDGVGRTKINNDISAFINVVGEWIYYSNISDENYVYKIKTNGTGKTIVIDEAATFLNVTNDSIYYLDFLNEGRVIRRDLSGSSASRQVQSLDFGFFINIIDNLVFYQIEEADFIYYAYKDGVNREMKFGMDVVSVPESKLTIKVGTTKEALVQLLPKDVRAKKIDGTEITLPVSWNADEMNITKAGEYVYEATLPGYKVKALLKLKVIEIISIEPDIINEVLPQNFVYPYEIPYGVTIKYSDGSYENEFIFWDKKIDTSIVGDSVYEGKTLRFDKKVILNLKITPSNFMEVLGQDKDWTYYRKLDSDRSIYKMNHDGTNKTRLTDVQSNNAFLDGEYIYYTDFRSIYKIKTDGTGLVNLCSGYIYNFEKHGEWIYYNDTYNEKFYKVKDDGSEKIQLAGKIYNYYVQDGWIYYSLYDNSPIYKIKDDGTGKQLVPYSGSKIINISGNTLYIVGNGTIKAIDMTTNKEIILTNNFYHTASIDGEWIYYVNAVNKISRVRLDGTEKTSFDDTFGNILKINDGWIYYRDIQKWNIVYKIKVDGTDNQISDLQW